MTDDDKWREAEEALAATDYQKGKILIEAERIYGAATDIDELKRAKNNLITAIQNGPRFHPSLVPTPLTDEMIDDAFDDTLRPNAWKTEMVAEVETEYQSASSNERQLSLRRLLMFCSVSVLITSLAFLMHWQIGMIVGLILLAFACWATNVSSE
jgi:hypothetical protein